MSLDALWRELGIDPATLHQRGVHVVRQASQLTPVGLGTDGRDKLLTPSAFRSVDYQAALLRARLARGESIEQVLRINAAPGCSEHHSGRAVDIGTPGCGGCAMAACRSGTNSGFQKLNGG